MTRVYQYWTQEDIDLLKHAIDNTQKVRGKINWDAVAAKVRGRNRQQCKSFYTNKLRQTSENEHRQYYVWSLEEEELLQRQMKAASDNIKLVQQKFFPHLTVKQLYTKYKYINKQIAQKITSVKEEKHSNEVFTLVKHYLSDSSSTSFTIQPSCSDQKSKNVYSQMPETDQHGLENTLKYIGME